MKFLVVALAALAWYTPASATTIISGFGASSTVTASAGNGIVDDGWVSSFGLFDRQTLTALSIGPGSVTITTSGTFQVSAGALTVAAGQARYYNGSNALVDLSNGSHFALAFLGANTTGADVLLTLEDNTAAQQTLSFTGGAGLGTAAAVLLLPTIAFSGVDLTNIASVYLTVGTNGGASIPYQASFDNLALATPEPGSIDLLGVGALTSMGLALFYRRRERIAIRSQRT